MKPMLFLTLVAFALQSLALPKAFAAGKPTKIAKRGVAQNEELDRLFDEDDEDATPPGTFQPNAQNNATAPGGQVPPTTPGATQPDAGAGFPPDAGTESASPRSSGGSGRTAARPQKPGKTAKATTKAPVEKAIPKPPVSTADIEDITDENYPDLIESFDYPNAEITDVIKAISTLTGKNFIVDPGVHGKITIIAPTQISVAEAYKAFLSALAINGFTVVPSGKFLKVKTAHNAQRDSIETYSGSYYPTSDIMITRIIHLKHTSAEEINKRMRNLPSKDGDMMPYEPTNSLIISDYGANIERIMKIVQELDRPGFDEQLELIPIKYAKAKDLADLLNQIINKEVKGSQPPGFGVGVPRFRGGANPNGSGHEELSLVAPDDRTNAIIVVGNQAGVEKIKSLVKKLDYKLDPNEGGGVFVYYVKYGEAKKIATTMSGVAQATTPGAGGSSPGGFPGVPGGFRPPSERTTVFGGDVKITADENTNSLVITASKQDYEVVLNLLSKIDIPRNQVYVEAIIMEMTSTKSRVWNPAYYYLDPGSNGKGRAGFSKKGTLANIIDPTQDQGAILGFGTGGSLTFQIAGQPVVIPSILAFVNFLQTNTESNVLSTPQILALDNEAATIEVGDTIPIAQDSSTANGVTNTTTRFEKASIKLEITPFIRPDSDVIRMKVKQSVKQPTKSDVIGAKLAESSTVISDRAIDTNIVVHDRDTAVLGGLMKDQDLNDETKIPILGDIPVLGWLFKSSTVNKSKVNLIVFLTPKILRNIDDGHNLLNRKANERIDWIKSNFDGKDPYGKRVDQLPRAAKSDGDDSVDQARKKQ